MSKRFWPIHLGFNRCTAYFWSGDEGKCNKLIWPWQNVIRNPEPESYGILHHKCYHKEVKSLWTHEDVIEDNWKENWSGYLWCEHRGKLDAEDSLA